MSIPTAPSSHYRPDIDGLRALAVLAVVVFHATPAGLPGGYLGVDVFFVISGYLIAGIILEEVAAGRFSFADFYLRRARRILPALLLMLFTVTALALLVLMPDELERFGRSLVASAAMVPNFQLMFDSGYFDDEARLKPLLHLWSLGVEEQFYLMCPVLLLALARAGRRLRVGVLAALAIASWIAYEWIASRDSSMYFYLPLTRMWELLFGVLLAAHGRDAAAGLSVAARTALSCVGISLMAASFSWASPASTHAAATLAPTLGALLFIAAGPLAWPNRSVFSARAVVYVGLISYPLYLWHWPLLSFVHSLQIDALWDNRALRAGAVLAALVLAALTYQLIERRLRRRRDLVRVGAVLFTLLAIAAATGIVLVSTHGLPQRTDNTTDPLAWPPALRVEEGCLERYFPGFTRDSGVLCVRQRPEVEPEVVLLGDSHANALWPGLRAAAAGRSLLHVGASSCPFLRDLDFRIERRGMQFARCSERLRAAYGAIGPATRVVVLNAADAVYFSDPAGFVTPADPASTTAQYESALLRDLTELLGNGREVVLVLPTPDFDLSPKRCLRTRLIDRLFTLHGTSTCVISRDRVRKEQAGYRSAVERAARSIGNDRLRVIDPLDALCDAHQCSAFHGSTPLYRDSHHLSVQGSTYVWATISRQLPAGHVLSQ